MIQKRLVGTAMCLDDIGNRRSLIQYRLLNLQRRIYERCESKNEKCGLLFRWYYTLVFVFNERARNADSDFCSHCNLITFDGLPSSMVFKSRHKPWRQTLTHNAPFR